ncbi:MAG: Holliday junction resolvase RecU [Lachnospiraceae bacterium]|jgi:recombination protein U|nr:Holliday junction resolvase RecU [Lachnospiraceae bacterium]MCR4777962.1 Holliday junction resolvase RecU [Lachnospiraceae bacterium]
MPSWNSRGLRGSALEELINRSNEKYLEKGLACIQKIPTPITPIKINPSNKQITLAYFDKKSTVDYIGVVQGVPVCFDAKECVPDTFALANIHEHQIEFMKTFEKQDGIAFLLIHFVNRDKLYFMPFSEVNKFWERAKEGGRKSFRYDELDEGFEVLSSEGVPVHYLEALRMYLERQ